MGKLSWFALRALRFGDGALEDEGEESALGRRRPELKSGEYWANMVARRLEIAVEDVRRRGQRRRGRVERPRGRTGLIFALGDHGLSVEPNLAPSVHCGSGVWPASLLGDGRRHCVPATIGRSDRRHVN
jgi:hypothetical protein